ncbi:hypothetical protein OGAPHI_001976 [Ogataea philodendri]|uniref:Leucine carboxyl methyltransferase 1 n=1 Tax=Ogataea philodendri TaxID=1378263 RepID=A0A9P8PA45_9ASCO|nr:uncharacterized protein OGAPHI_001976 [Ogataea philodendri]KAH3668222.1 hypothetical protein OGAPHI_001976 [Ogataea philodendri]
MFSQDQITRSTDYDALSCRLSCHLKGYLIDKYLEKEISGIIRFKLLSIESEFKRLSVKRQLSKQFFGLVDPKGGLKVSSRLPVVLKSPVINRGTWIRTRSIDLVIDQWLGENATSKVQLVILGSGNDTRGFRLLEKHPNLSLIEIDFEETCRIKKYSILNEIALKTVVDAKENQIPDTHEAFINSSASLSTPRYHLIPLDLRQLSSVSQLPSLDPALPTLVLTECCVCYMEDNESNRVLQFFRENLQSGVLVMYDPIGGDSSANYGQIMLQNLSMRGIQMPSLLKYSTIEKQHDRLRELGFSLTNVSDLSFVYTHWIDQPELVSINRLELLDELEELSLINKHYCLLVSSWGTSWRLAFPSQI